MAEQQLHQSEPGPVPGDVDPEMANAVSGILSASHNPEDTAADEIQGHLSKMKVGDPISPITDSPLRSDEELMLVETVEETLPVGLYAPTLLGGLKVSPSTVAAVSSKLSKIMLFDNAHFQCRFQNMVFDPGHVCPLGLVRQKCTVFAFFPHVL